MMKTAIMLCLLLIPLGFALAGWERTYGGSDEDCGRSVAQTSDGGYIVAGYTGSFGAGFEDVYLFKTDSSGDTIWTRTYGGSYDDRGYSVAQTSDGGYIVTGYTQSFGAGIVDVYLVKTDSSGDTIWTRTYGGSGDDGGKSVAQTSDGGYIVAGYTYSFGAGVFDVYLIKTDSSGDTMWTRTYGGSEGDWSYSVAQTADSGYIIAGTTEPFGAGLSDVYLIKTDSSGDTLWTRTYGGSNRDCGWSLAQTSDGGYVVAGWTYSFGAGNADVYLIRTNSSGDTIWTRTYGRGGADIGCSVTQVTDGGFIITGYTGSYPADGFDVYLILTDSSGDTLWTRTYGGSDDDYGNSVAQTTDGGFIVVGSTEFFSAGDYDVYLIKTDSLGYTAIGETPSARPEDIAISAYPNPFNSAVVISVGAIHELPLQIEIFDINGRLVAEIPVGEGLVPSRESGDHKGRPYETVWTPDDNTTSGVYLIKATVNNREICTKTIYLK